MVFIQRQEVCLQGKSSRGTDTREKERFFLTWRNRTTMNLQDWQYKCTHTHSTYMNEHTTHTSRHNYQLSRTNPPWARFTIFHMMYARHTHTALWLINTKHILQESTSALRVNTGFFMLFITQLTFPSLHLAFRRHTGVWAPVKIKIATCQSFLHHIR